MIVTDLDGTLLHSDTAISDYTISILKKCREKCIKVVYATARDNSATIPALSELVDGFVRNNGAKACIGNTLVYSRIVPVNNVRNLLVAAENAGAKITAENNGIYYANFNATKICWWIQQHENADFNTLDIEAEKLYIIADTINQSEGEKLINKYLPNDLDEIFINGMSLILIKHKEAIKSNGVAALAEHWGIKQSEIVAFGDSEIDIDLLEYCGIGIAVGNAPDEIKAVADYICETNDNDGVAKWLEEHILKA